MGGLFGEQWTRQFGLSDHTGEWGRTLADVTPEQMKIGLDRLRSSGSGWPPTAPQFRLMCLGVETLAPGFEVAYSEIVAHLQKPEHRRNTSTLSDAVYHTIQNNLDYFTFKSLTGGESMRVFKTAYAATIEQFKKGLVVQRTIPRAYRIADDSKGPRASQETMEQGINNLKSILGDEE